MSFNFFSKPKSMEDAIAVKKSSKLFFFIIAAILAALFFLGESLPLSSVGIFGVMIVCVPLAIFFGYKGFTNSAIEHFKLMRCDCGEAVAYNDDVTYETTSPKKNIRKNKETGEVTTTLNVDLYVAYTCPKCQKKKTYRQGFCIERIKQNAHGVILDHKKKSITDAYIVDFFKEGNLILTTLVDEENT